METIKETIELLSDYKTLEDFRNDDYSSKLLKCFTIFVYRDNKDYLYNETFLFDLVSSFFKKIEVLKSRATLIRKIENQFLDETYLYSGIKRITIEIDKFFFLEYDTYSNKFIEPIRKFNHNEFYTDTIIDNKIYISCCIEVDDTLVSSYCICSNDDKVLSFIRSSANKKNLLKGNTHE